VGLLVPISSPSDWRQRRLFRLRAFSKLAKALPFSAKRRYPGAVSGYWQAQADARTLAIRGPQMALRVPTTRPPRLAQRVLIAA